MRKPSLPGAALLLAPAALVPTLLGGCRALPPPQSVHAKSGIVRAESLDLAVEVASMLDALVPRVRALMPDTRTRALEVWIQETPALYRFPATSMNDADGFWAAQPREIHLRRSADDLERTLAHELAHASLGRSWRALPGTLEEGLCDVASARLCPEGAARLRAGRLSAAALATGGLVLEIHVSLRDGAAPADPPLDASVRLLLSSEPGGRLDPLEVFRVKAGFSSTSLPSDAKRAFYGLAFVAAERVVERSGFAGLHALAQGARDAGLSEIPVEALLAAADLDRDPATWRRAAAEALGPAELGELARIRPALVLRVLADLLAPSARECGAQAALSRVSARLSVPGGASVDLLSIPEVRRDLALDLSRPLDSFAAVD